MPPSRFRGRAYDSILVIVNRYIKLVRYISTIKGIDVIELAELFLLYIVKDFGVLEGMTLDKGLVFISKF